MVNRALGREPFFSPPSVMNEYMDQEKLIRLAREYYREKEMGDQVVRIGSSTIPGAGKGLFAQRDLEKLTPLVFYPGEYIPALPPSLFSSFDGSAKAKPLDGIIHDGEINTYLLFLQEYGGIIDGKGAPEQVPKYSGQLVNHPPQGTMPNVLNWEFLWNDVVGDDEAKSQQLVHLTGKPWYLDCDSNEFVYADSMVHKMPGMLFFTASDIKAGEELFWDYSMRDGTETFDWYHHVQYEN